MADKWQAIDQFFNSFGLTAYDERGVPEGVSVPYITYNAPIAKFEQPVTFSASIWYRSSSWREISQKADEIAQSLKGFKILPVDGGYLFMVAGSPFAQRMVEPGDDMIKRMYILIESEFLTEV